MSLARLTKTFWNDYAISCDSVKQTSFPPIPEEAVFDSCLSFKGFLKSFRGKHVWSLRFETGPKSWSVANGRKK